MMLTGTPGFRARRIEAGLLSAGNDFNSTTTPYEVGLSRFVDMSKGDFIGRDALKECETRNKIFGIKVKGGIPKRKEFFSDNGSVVGVVTSSTWSPFFECGVGIVRVEDTTLCIGSNVTVEGIDNKRYLGKLCTLPMYDKEGLIVRGKHTSVPTGPETWNG